MFTPLLALLVLGCSDTACMLAGERLHETRELTVSDWYVSEHSDPTDGLDASECTLMCEELHDDVRDVVDCELDADDTGSDWLLACEGDFRVLCY